MAQFGCGGSRCTCQVVAGPGATVTGNGSQGAPYVVSAEAGAVTCDQVRPCLSAGPGATYDPDTGVIGAEPTAVEAGDNVTVTGTGTTADPYVVAAEAADPTVVQAGDNVTVTGTGTAADPYVVAAEAADPTVVEAGDRVTVTGTGAAGDPYVVTADPPSCEDVRPCLSAGPGVTYDPETGVISSPPTVVQAGTNTTVTGSGTAADPYVVNAAGGGGGVDTFVEAGDRTTVTGAGTLADPYVVSADPPSCEDVRPCLVAGEGIDYDPDTGTIAARPSTDAGNTLTIGTDGGLLVPGVEPLETGCGLTGDGTADAPLELATVAWPYPCAPEAAGTAVACDANGVLRGAPESRSYFDQFTESRDYANIAVPAGFDNVADTFTWSYTNPDPCRPVIVFLERESDVDFDLPAGAGAASGQDTDEMTYTRNTGTTTIVDHHTQVTKVYRHQTSLAPGATANVSFPVTIGRGSGAATYNRIQIFLRAMMHTL